MRYSYPVIPTLCHCGCNEVLWHRGQRYVSGHDSRVIGVSNQEGLKLGRYRKGKQYPIERYPDFGMRNKQHTLEAIEKVKIARAVQTPPRLGKLHNDSSKKKMSDTRKKNLILHPEFYYHILSENGKKAHRLHPGLGIINLIKHSKILYNNEKFLSKHEVECYKLLESLGLIPNKDFFHDYVVGTKRIDFYIPRLRLFWEHHPLLPYHKISLEEYWKKRADVLKDNGYNGSYLFVTKDLKELKTIKELIINESFMVW